MINFALGVVVALAIISTILLAKVKMRCRGCQVKDQAMGAQAGVAAQMTKEIEHLKGLLDRALVKQGTIAKDPKDSPAPAPVDPREKQEEEQIERAVKSGGEVYGGE